MNLKDDQKKELLSILQNRAGFGAFSGMIINASLKEKAWSVETLIEHSLNVRLLLKELAR